MHGVGPHENEALMLCRDFFAGELFDGVLSPTWNNEVSMVFAKETLRQEDDAV